MFGLCVSIILLSTSQAFLLGSPPSTVPAIELDRFIGRWYQVYCSQSVATLWESGAVCVTADYEYGPNGTLTVLNSERLRDGHDGPLTVIHGYAKKGDAPGHLTVHLEGVPVDAPYWIMKLGPPTFGPNGQYEYAAISDNYKATLFVLARDPKSFAAKFEQDLLLYLSNIGFTGFYNKPVKTYHGDDCLYNKDHH